MTVEDWTETTFDAAHRKPWGEAIHGHTWHVRVFWPADPPRDATALHAMLVTIVDVWDHGLLDDHVDDPSNRGVAQAVAQLMGHLITEVWVWREGRVPCGCRLRL